MAEKLRPWFEGVRLYPDVESGKLSRATFAIDFGGVLSNSEGVPLVYRDSHAFWQATHLTSGVKRLLEEVFTRLSESGGDRVLQLRSPFGGGKSHVLLAIYHAARDVEAFKKIVSQAKDFKNPGKIRIAGIDGEKFDPVVGTEINGHRVHTLWGALAAHLQCYNLMEEQEQTRIAPGGEIVKQILSDKPTLILLDEILRYVERAMGIQVGDSNLGRQSLEFLQTLTTEIANSSKCIIIYSLQASGREAFDNVGLLNSLDHLVGRVDAKREPISGDEILDVLKKRLLSELPDESFAKNVASSIAKSVTRWKTAEAPDEHAKRSAQDEEVKLTTRLQSAFPFHIGLIDVMKERWASIPEFERTRGALRFLAAVLYKSKQLGKQTYQIGPGDIPLEDADVRNAFFTEVGQREPYQAVLEHDITGVNARVKRIDKQLAQQNPALALVRPATRLAIAILMYSFGGIQRQEGSEFIPPGILEKELLEVTLGPDLDNITAQSVLKRLRDECLYLHFDGLRYSFKTTPNVNKILEDESDSIRADEVRNYIRTELEKRISVSTKSAIIWPQDSNQIPDRDPRFIIAYLPLEFSEKTEHDKNEIALKFLTQSGSQLRIFRNGLGLAIPEKKSIEGLRRASKYILAAERVKQKKSVYKLSKEQLDQLKEREDTEKAAFESGLRSLYNSIWFLKMQNVIPTIEQISVGGRPLREQGIHERLMELLKDVSQRLFSTLKPLKIVDRINLGSAAGQLQGIDTKTLRDSFFQSLDFPRLESDKIIMDAIAQGIQIGLFGYALRNQVREESGKYIVKLDDAIIQRTISSDEIDLESGFIFIPSCIETQEPGEEITITTSPPSPPTVTPGTPKTPTPVCAIKKVSITMIVSKQTLYKTFNALGNLAEKAGFIKLQVEAEKPEGMDKNWLRNAVKEPLEESGVDSEIREE